MGSEEYAKRVAELTGGKVESGKDHDRGSDHGVTLDIGNGLGVIFWMDQFRKDGKSPEWAAGYIRGTMKKEKDVTFDQQQIMNKGKVKRNLRIMLQHRRRNPEVFRSATEYGYHDLVLVPYVKVEISKAGKSHVRVKSRMLDHWNMSPKECIDIAIENSRKDWEIRSISELVEELGIHRPETDPDVPEMLVVSNKDRYLGAVAEIFAREELLKILGAGYTAIPSSRHEMMLLNRRQSDRDILDSMVRDINESEVDVRDRLSDHTYEIW